jgi:transcriptional regulator with XRE-family HTH domain
VTTVSGFSQWLESEMKARDWRQKDLIVHSGIGSGLISQFLSGQRTPGVETCRAIAKALGLKEITVLKIAGLIEDDEPQKFSPLIESMAAMLKDLPEEKQEEFRAQLRFQWEREQMKKAAAKPAKGKA